MTLLDQYLTGQNDYLRQKVRVALWQQVSAIAAEGAGVEDHTNRLTLAAQVSLNVDQWARWGAEVLAAGGLTQDSPDEAIEGAVAALIPAAVALHATPTV